MAGKGGYMRPNKPAAVSGPGKLSKRTDGKPGETPTQAARYISGGSYGEGQELMALQQDAPLAAAASNEVPSVPEPVRLKAPTQRPDEPVTAGAPFGDGPGPEAMPRFMREPEIASDEVSAELRAMLLAYPSSTWLQNLVSRLNAEGR